MFDRESLIEIASGEKRGIYPSIVRGGMWVLSLFYGLAIRWRNWRFDGGNKVTKVDAPVISVGNITTGGTGKSPLVIWVAKFLRSLDVRVAVLSRGYGAQPHQTSDEALEFQQRLLDVPHIQGANRVASAEIAIEELEMQALLLDDAFQHRKIARELDIIVIDCTRPFGFGHLLPRGLLREPVSSIRRAQFIVLTRCDLVTEKELDDIESRINKLTGCPIARTRGVARHLIQADGQTHTIESLLDKKAFAFCGIGNHENFWTTLEQLNFSVMGKLPFPDHHNFDREDVNRIGSTAARRNAEMIICTHKDLVKIATSQLNEIPTFALIVEVDFLTGQKKFENAIEKAVSSISTDD